MLFRTVVPLTPRACGSASPRRSAHANWFVAFKGRTAAASSGHRAGINPLGTIFNPVSLARVVALLASGKEVLESDLEYCDRQQHYFSFEAGTSMVGEMPAVVPKSSLRLLVQVGRRSLNLSVFSSPWARHGLMCAQEVASCQLPYVVPARHNIGSSAQVNSRPSTS